MAPSNFNRDQNSSYPTSPTFPSLPRMTPKSIKRLKDSLQLLGEPTFNAMPDPSNPDKTLLTLGWSKLPDMSIEVSGAEDGAPLFNLKGDTESIDCAVNQFHNLFPGYMIKDEDTWKDSEGCTRAAIANMMSSTEHAIPVQEGAKTRRARRSGNKSSHDANTSAGTSQDTDTKKPRNDKKNTPKPAAQPLPDLELLPAQVQKILTGHFPGLGKSSITLDHNQLFPEIPDMILRWSKVPDACLKVSAGEGTCINLNVISDNEESVRRVIEQIGKVVPGLFPEGHPLVEISDNKLLSEIMGKSNSTRERSTSENTTSFAPTGPTKDEKPSSKNKKKKKKSKAGAKAKVEQDAGIATSSNKISSSQLHQMTSLFPEYGPQLRKIIETDLPVLGEPAMRIEPDHCGSSKPCLVMNWSNLPEVLLEVFYGRNGAALSLDADQNSSKVMLNEFRKVVPGFLPAEDTIFTACEGEWLVSEGKVVGGHTKYSFDGSHALMQRMRREGILPNGDKVGKTMRSARRSDRVKDMVATAVCEDEIDQQLEALAVSDRYWNYTRPE